MKSEKYLRDIEEAMVQIHDQIEYNKALYTDLHLRVLELAKQERKQLKTIILLQNEELKIMEKYEKGGN